jgi:hypothetical protein
MALHSIGVYFQGVFYKVKFVPHHYINSKNMSSIISNTLGFILYNSRSRGKGSL